jgi:hypothetical protein
MLEGMVRVFPLHASATGVTVRESCRPRRSTPLRKPDRRSAGTSSHRFLTGIARMWGHSAPPCAGEPRCSVGMTRPAIAAAMGVSLSTVNRAHMAYTTAASMRVGDPSWQLTHLLKPRKTLTVSGRSGATTTLAQLRGAGVNCQRCCPHARR